jgi:hypothetical protein
MPVINSCQFGSITIDGKKYGQVLILGDRVEERDEKKLQDMFGTTHRIGPWEIAKLIDGSPEVVFIGTGQEGVLEVDEDVSLEIEEAGPRLIVQPTPQAVVTYNELVKRNKIVNALIHTTC